MSQGPPLERFLGVTDSASGPASVLGVEELGLTHDGLRSALAERLAHVDAHPQARSADADEVRLALHVAAAQLAESMTEPGVDRPADTQRPMRPIVPDTPGARDEQRRRTLMALIAHSGGWNATARHRVASVAHASGVSVDEAIRLLTGTPEAGLAERAPAPVPVMFDRPNRLGVTPMGRVLLGASAVCAFCSTIMVIALVWIIASRVDDNSGAPDVPTPAQGVSVVGAPQAVSAAPTPVVTDLDSLLDAYKSAGADERAFALVYRASRDAWTDMEPGAFGRLAYAAAEAIDSGRSAQGGMLELLREDVRTDAPVARSLFASAALGRASAFGVAIGEFDFGIASGASSASAFGAARLAVIGSEPDVDASAWSDGAHAFLVQHKAEGEAALLALIDTLVRRPGEMSEASARVLEEAVLMREWGPSDQESVLVWWDDGTVGIDRLSIVGAALVRSGDLELEGFALSPGSSTSERSLSRGVIAVAFGAESSTPIVDNFSNAWRRAFDAVSVDDTRAGDVEVLTQAARWSLLSRSAALWNGGDRGAALALIVEDDDESGSATGVVYALRAKIDDAPSFDMDRLTAPTASPDGVWAVRFLSARRSEDARITLIGELTTSDRALGPADADVLARASMVGANRAVRSAAQLEVRRRASSPYVVHGMIESVHAAASQPDVSEMIAYVSGRVLPSSGAGSWRIACRRALLERFAELALEGASGGVNEAERVMAESYAERARIASGLPTEAESAPEDTSVLVRSLASIGEERARTRTLVESTELLWEALHERASLIPEGGWASRSLVRIERRHGARSGYAAGVLQGFALDQLGLVEILAYLVSAERPAVADAIEARVARHEKTWRESESVTDQVRRSERAMAWLWGVRLGVIEEGG